MKTYGRLFIVLLMLSFTAPAAARCVADGETFTVKEGISACIEPGKGHKIVHCTVSAFQQSSYLLITHTNFIADSPYHMPKDAIYIDENEKRLVFTGLGIDKTARLEFHYFGPWDPSYQFDMTCSW